ncbi:DUF3047 domain-containing protein [Marivita sp. GX14005]|uniref:DUF3047 domain-containing protein n=1 Tax=Marivita sp. GX14005 TaxID=2942276 RepID=UPI0020184C62|nr:DUF3047 domain-containing protein [Marivita sp. GX14005]MCL3880751.1 DUF3047 domain-containing protein [Marivita sp. GX14005]
MFRPIAAAFCLTALPVFAAPVAFDGAWKTQRFSLFSANSYGFNGGSLSVASDGSVSLAYRELPPGFANARSARWTWQVSEGVPATDLTRKGGDDRNLALYFVFLPASQAAALRGSSVRQLLTNDAARVLVYVWGGAHKRGAVLPSPYLGSRGKTVVLRGSGTGRASENVDLARDYARAFGGGDAALVGLAVSGDSDDTNSRIRASISDLRVE